ncbi:phage tail tape measure protein [Kitasatospora sp. CB02891]|uniref:phage tail tape measure protein n=1 Tax=Kitasatospora sp. CB02891 TaxID=2020329 RepID=UPI000C2731C1|nr:phage tail tape measure protein [Kitasatospora sp. CB02891]PJN24066.1 phage tail tape measure protein [Kitasatospora sp. CB02891]
MADRTVAVRLNLDTSGYRRGAVQAEQATEQVAASAAAAGAQSQQAFGRAATGIQSSMQRASRSVGTFGQTVQESTSRTTVGLGRMELAARELPGPFQAASRATTQSLGQISTSATAAASAVVAADTRMTEASVASAQGIRTSLATRLAVAEAVVQQEVRAAARAEETSAVTVGAYGRMAAAARAWGTSVQSSAASGVRAMAAAGESGERAFTGVRTAGLLLVGAFAAASVAAARFEKSMSGVYAVADANTQQMGELRSAAIEAGRATSFSASQAADAEAELARAGVSVADITGGALQGSLALAAAGQLSLSESAVVAAQAMNTFGLKGYQVGHIADVLASGANKSAADVHGLGESLRMGGLLAHQTGLDLEDTVGVLSAFADHALIGSDAGTSLKTMLQRLTPQSGEAADMMQQLGFSAFDTSGRFVGLEELAARMKRAFSQLTPEARNLAMATIFGSDAVRAATILYEQGATGIMRYRDAVNDQGAAQRMASVQTNNLAGDLERLTGSLEVALIEGGSDANQVLREMVKWITDVVDAYSALPGWLQTTATGLALVAGAIALVVGGLMLGLPRVMAFRASIAALATTMPRLASAMTMTLRAAGGIGAVLAVATVALGIFGQAQNETKARTEDLTAAIKADNAAIGTNTRAWLAHELETRGALKSARALSISTQDLTEAILNGGAAATRVQRQLSSLYDSIDANRQANTEGGGQDDRERVKQIKAVQDALSQLNPQVNESVAAAKREAEATGAAADSTGALGKSALKTADDLENAKSASDQLHDSLMRLNGINIDAASSAIKYQKSLQDLRDAVAENGRSLDITTEKGRAVKTAVLGAASAASDHAEAVMKQTNSMELAQAAYQDDVAGLKETMRAAGFTTDQIKSLTSAYAQLPMTKQTEVTDPGAVQTIKDLTDIKARLSDIPPGKTITVKAPSDAAIQDLQAIGYRVEHLPDGKVKITVPTDDAFGGINKIQAAINGISDKSVKVLVNGTVTLNGEYLHGGRGPGFANGGVVHAASGYTVPGYAPRQDTVPAMLSPGEGVLVPETVRRLGGAPAIDALNAWGRYNAPAPQLIPARALVSTGGGGGSYDHSRTTNVTLHGARMTEAEQAAGLLRLLDFYG